jgi:uncharacterized protein YndB with AHSA1/START domain
MKYLETTPQERLAYAWAIAESNHRRLPTVSERILTRCREAAYQLSSPDCWLLLSEVPAAG